MKMELKGMVLGGIIGIIVICIFDYFLSETLFICANVLFIAFLTVVATVIWVRIGVLDDRIITLNKRIKKRQWRYE